MNHEAGPFTLQAIEAIGHTKEIVCSYNWPSAREINLIPSKELLAICIANRGIDIVVVKDRAKAWVSEDTLSTRSVYISVTFENNRTATIRASDTVSINLGQGPKSFSAADIEYSANQSVRSFGLNIQTSS